MSNRLQERLKRTNKLVKKPAKGNGAGEAAKEGTAVGQGSAGSGEKSSPNLKALLRGLSGRSGASAGGGVREEPCSRSGETYASHAK